jgi:DNA-binding NarL/FixJ family response regulator
LFDLVYWLVVLSTVVTLAFAWGVFLNQILRGRTERDEEYEKLEERILELMGQFRHMSALRLRMLDKKIEEMKALIKQANSLYSQLCVREAELMGSFSKVETERFESDVKERDAQKVMEEDAIETENSKNELQDSDLSIERKILLMYQEGKDEQQIAKELNMGVGEVSLVLSLFRFRSDSHP